MSLSDKVEKFIRANYSEFVENPQELEKILWDERQKAVRANQERFEQEQIEKADQHAKRVERIKEYYADTLRFNALFPITDQDLLRGHFDPLGNTAANWRTYRELGGDIPPHDHMEQLLFFLAIGDPQIMASENGSSIATIHPSLTGVTYETFWSFYTPCLEASGVLDAVKIDSIRSQLLAIQMGAKNVK